MKKVFSVTFAVLLFFAGIISIFAQTTEQLRFEKITTAEGLSSSSVSGICQDNAGFLWFATQAGLNRYDGKTIKVFENRPFDDESLVHNQIQTIYADKDGSLWIGTYGGLSRFTPSDGKFKNFVHDAENSHSLSNNVVTAIERDFDGRLWVGTLDGLNRLDEQTGEFVRYKGDAENAAALPNSVVRSILRDSRGRLWVGTYGGLSLYHAAADSFKTLSGAADAEPSFGTSFVMAIKEDPEDSSILWLGTWGGGLCRFDTDREHAEVFKLPDDRVYTLYVDSSKRLWVGTWGGGLMRFSRRDGEVSRFTSAMRDGIPHDIAYSLFQDKAGVFWVGTNGGGVAKMVDWRNQYRYYRQEHERDDSLPPGKVTVILADRYGNKWYAVYNRGLHLLDEKTGTFKSFRHDKDTPGSLSNDIINYMSVDRAGRLWICTNSGLNLFNPKDGTFSEPFKNNNDFPIKDTIFYCYFEDSAGNIWIGTYTEGLYRFNSSMTEYVRFGPAEEAPRKLSDNLIRVVFEDSRSDIWIGTNNGLHRYDVVSGAMDQFLPDKISGKSVSHGNIRDIKEAPNGDIYIATMGGGVNIYNKNTGAFSYLTRDDGLSSNMVIKILIDTEYIYFSTQVGVSVYNPKTGAFKTIDESVGLLSNEMTDGIMKDQTGALHFGSIAGVTIIPSFTDLPEGPTPPVVITDLKVMGRQVSIQDPGASIYQEIVLPYKFNTFSVEYSVLDYANPSQNLYAIMLEGLEKEWHAPERRNYASYSGLPPGSYNLRITGAGSRNNWNNEGVTLPVRVLFPWWRTIWAFAAYGALFLGSIAAIFITIEKKRRKNRDKLRQKEAHTTELELKVAERTKEIEEARREAEEATHAKSIFMASMSHEIRTPLNGISGMLSLLKRTELSDEQGRLVGFAKTASENLFSLVNDVLDFERIMSGGLVVNPEVFSLKEALDFVAGMYGPQAADRGLKLVLLVSPQLPDSVLGDRVRTIQITANLVGNALKYTEKGTIHITAAAAAPRPVEEENGTKPGEKSILVQIKVQDTGIGIASDKMERIFEDFYQVNTGYTSNGKGVGLGLSIVKQLCSLMGGTIEAKSEWGVGSTFTATLPYERLESENVSPEEGVKAQAGEMVSGTRTEAAMPRPPEKTLRILAAEDEAINSLFLESILKMKGYEVTITANGRDAVDAYTKGRFDIVLLDLGMPILGGLEAAAEIRSYEKSKDLQPVPIVALTGYAQQKDIDGCFIAGMNDVITKPINEGLLFKKIAEWTARE